MTSHSPALTQAGRLCKLLGEGTLPPVPFFPKGSINLFLQSQDSNSDQPIAINQDGNAGHEIRLRKNWSFLVWRDFFPVLFHCAVFHRRLRQLPVPLCHREYFPTSLSEGSLSYSTSVSNFSAVENSLHLSRCLNAVYRTPVSSFGSPSPLPPNYKIVDCCSSGLFFIFFSLCTKCQIAEIKNVNDGV